MELSKEALESRRAYQREYMKKYRERHKNNKNYKDKRKEYEANYWERKAQQQREGAVGE